MYVCTVLLGLHINLGMYLEVLFGNTYLAIWLRLLLLIRVIQHFSMRVCVLIFDCHIKINSDHTYVSLTAIIIVLLLIQ